MPGLKVEEPETVKLGEPATAGTAYDPLAGKELQCPYCGWVYLPEEGCFCLRLVGWDSARKPR